MKAERCSNCRFWAGHAMEKAANEELTTAGGLALSAPQQAPCWRHPPQVGGMVMQQTLEARSGRPLVVWSDPMTLADHFCGEFQLEISAAQ